MMRSWFKIRKTYATVGAFLLVLALACAACAYLLNAIIGQQLSVSGAQPAQAPEPEARAERESAAEAVSRRSRRRLFRTGKIVASLSSFLLVLVLAGGAFAYWTSTGTGEGTVKAQSSAAVFTLENGTEPTGLYPGGTKEATVKIKNNEPFGEHYKKLVAEVKEVENAASSEAEAEAGSKCWAGWFEITAVGGEAGSSHEFNETIAASVTVEKKVTLKMKEVEKNQNGCQNKKVTLKYKVE